MAENEEETMEYPHTALKARTPLSVLLRVFYSTCFLRDCEVARIQDEHTRHKVRRIGQGADAL